MDVRHCFINPLILLSPNIKSRCPGVLVYGQDNVDIYVGRYY